MIRLPELMAGNRQQQMTTTFSGYNRQEVLYDGQMYDTQNLSGDMYPVLSLRKKRGHIRFDAGGNTDRLSGINGRDQLTFVLGQKVYYNFMEVSGLRVSDDPAFSPKKIVNFGAYVCIWPDKVYFNTINLADSGSMERRWPAEGSGITGEDISLIMCRGDGTNYDMTQITVSAAPPENPVNGKLWMDQSGDNDVLRQWDQLTEEWVEVATTFVKIQASNIGSGLSEYDAITLSGLEAVTGAPERIARQVAALNGSYIVYAAGTDYIVIAGLISETQLALKDNAVHADLLVPDMDYVCESNNRLWGCHYGLDSAGQVVNEIRCSALGSFKNWQRFLGNSQDSYVASVGTDGPFTGAITQRGYPVFFKENCIHRVSGMTPSSFSIQTTIARGVQRGSWRSLAVVNENIYYKARDGVMMYDGNMPVSISEALGDIHYTDARAGTLRNKYYISMQDAAEAWHQFTYDTERQLWYREDSFHALGFGFADNELYMIDEDNNLLVTVTGSAGEPEDELDWLAEFGIGGVQYSPGQGGYGREDSAGSRYLSRFNIRMYLDEAATAVLEIMYDDDGDWRRMGEIRGSRTMKNRMIPVIPRRCDHLRFRIRGTGDCRIYSISRILEVGSDG